MQQAHVQLSVQDEQVSAKRPDVGKHRGFHIEFDVAAARINGDDGSNILVVCTCSYGKFKNCAIGNVRSILVDMPDLRSELPSRIEEIGSTGIDLSAAGVRWVAAGARQTKWLPASKPAAQTLKGCVFFCLSRVFAVRDYLPSEEEFCKIVVDPSFARNT
eukprot:SAG31_NODE_9554_length_1261_cov_2.375862_2_plen_160_part_00